MSLSISGRTWEEASSPAAVRLARRFEDAWRQAPAHERRPEPREFLVDDSACPGARLALLRADMALRWESGEQVKADWYRARHPDMGDETLVALIYEEFCLREEFGEGESPDPSEYFDQYPEVEPALRRVLDIHGLVGSGTTTGLHAGETSQVVFPVAGETIAGFRLVEELGRGAFARVFLAQERQLADRPVALKVARTGSREPQTLARLQHTHIVPVHSYRTDPATDLHLLCMPYFGRVTLARLLAEPSVQTARSGIELVEALDRLGASEPAPGGRSAGRAALARRSFARAIAWWGARMAEALEHAHDRGVLHRDVKPSNVLVTGDGMPMLLDFNLAREAVTTDGEAEHSVPGGTLDYMSPEHLEELAFGRSDRVDARSDIYGLGVLLFEALAGTRPYAAPRGSASATEMLLRAAEGRRDELPALRDIRFDVPASLEAVVRRCLEPDPADRYASAAELAADLQAVADDRTLVYASEPIADRLYRWGRRHGRAMATALPVLLVLAGMVALLVQKKADLDRSFAKVRWFYDAGMESLAAGNTARAMIQFQSAVRLADQPSDSHETTPATPGPSGLYPSLEALRQQANFRYSMARRTEEYREKADALSTAAHSLRFRLFGFGRDLGSASAELARVLEPFHVFEPDDWLRRPDLTLLDEPRKTRLVNEVNELLFLWAVALDSEGDDHPFARQKAIEVCNLALTFVRPDGVWRALRDVVSSKLENSTPRKLEGPESSEVMSPLACFQWGVLLFRRNERKEAVEWFKKAVQDDEGNYWLHYYLAFAHDQPGGNPAAALRHYDASVALRPRSPWVRFTRARCYRLGHDWVKAEEELRVALRDFHALASVQQDKGFESQTRLELGLAKQSLGDLTGAKAEYAVVISANSSSEYAFAARLNRAKLDADAGDIRLALADFDSLLEARPDDGPARLSRAMLALRAGDSALAESDLSLRIASPLDPSNRAQALGLRALARLSLGRVPEAVDDAESAFRLRPGPAVERLKTRARIALGKSLGIALSRPEDIAELPFNGPSLRADLRQLVEQLRSDLSRGEPSSDATLEARMTLAVALCALGDRSADREADAAIASSPQSARAFLVRARIRAKQGQSQAARLDVDRALSLDPDDPRGYEFRGHLRGLAGDRNGALADFERTIALGFEGASVYRERAAVLLAHGDIPAAIGDWRHAQKRDPDDPRASLGLAESYLAIGQWDQAFSGLEQAAAWTDGRPGLGLRIALAYVRCLPHRPQQFPRVAFLIQRVVADSLACLATPKK